MFVTGSNGKATRLCDKAQLVPWQEPDLFNCTSAPFYQLRKQVILHTYHSDCIFDLIGFIIDFRIRKEE